MKEGLKEVSSGEFRNHFLSRLILGKKVIAIDDNKFRY